MPFTNAPAPLIRSAASKRAKLDRAQIEADRGEHTFWYDAINDLMDKDVPALYDAAMAEHGFVAVANPVYDLVSVKKDEGFVATATVALQPELNLTKTTGFVRRVRHPGSDRQGDRQCAGAPPRGCRRAGAAQGSGREGQHRTYRLRRACWRASPSRAAPQRTRPSSWAAAA